MMRVFCIVVAMAAGVVAGCASHESADAPVPAAVGHLHAQSEDGDTCEALCFPGSCSHSFGISDQSVGACKDKGPSLCVCTYPRD